MAASAAIALFGCSAPSPVATSTTPAPGTTDKPATATPAGAAERQAQAGRAATTFFDTARAGDRDAFRRTLSDRDPVFADRARLLFDNLSRLPLSRLDVRLEPGPRSPSKARLAVLGADAWTQPVTVSWQLTGESAPAQHTVWLTFTPAADGAVLIAGTADTPADQTGAARPGWWLGPVDTRRSVAVTVLTGSGQSAERWRDRAERALADVRRHLPSTTEPTGRGPLVLEVPASTADFEAVVGVPAGSYADIAAVSLAEGPAATAAVHVVVNPAAARRLTADGLALTLAHEVVHVVTRSPSSPAPSWAVEGVADYVALAAYPAARPTVTAALRADVRAHGAPDHWPTDAAFAADAGGLDLVYAEAWSICRYVADSFSADRLGQLYRALDRGRTVDQASTEVLGVGEAELTAGWRAWLADEAR